MQANGATVAGAVLGVVGLALLLVESIRALTGSAFSTFATILLYGGLGLIVIAGAALVVAVSAQPTVSDAELDG